MTGLGIFLVILAIAGLIGVKIMRGLHEGKLEKMRVNAQLSIKRGDMDENEAEQLIAAEVFWAPLWVNKALIGVVALGVFLSMFNGMFFYAEPTFKYHVRPIWGGEYVVSGKTGYSVKGFGRVNNWKIAMSVQATPGGSESAAGAESETSISANLPNQNIVFLDQVDSAGSATVRFRLPDDEDMFLELVHDFRSPENFLNTELIPAFKETFQATGSLMSAEEYFSGGRTDFNNEFANQMDDGIYLVRRIQVTVKDPGASRKSSADASAPEQDEYSEDEGKVVYKVEKRLDSETGLPLRKVQKFKGYGVTVVSARVTDMVPNKKFRSRMEAKQDASAKRAVNREERIQEEEQKFLAIARGEREIAERQAAARKVQIEKTTNAETTKRLALIAADQRRQEALIAKETAAIQLEQAKIDAQKVKELADAEAYRKKEIILADNALDKKLKALVEIARVQAKALAERAVPNTVIYRGGGGDAALGSSTDVQSVADTQLLKNLKMLDLNVGIAPSKARVRQ